MSNGYGSSSSGGSSGSSRRSNQSSQRRTDPQSRVAPEGFHYMPDGTLMSNAEHAELYKRESKCYDVVEYKAKASAGYHAWEICAVETPGGVLHQGSFWPINTAAPSPPAFGFAFQGCPLNPFSFGPQFQPWTTQTGGILPTLPVHFQAFYDWVVQELGFINVGDAIEIDMTNTAPPGTPGNAPLDGSVMGTGICNLGPYADVDKLCLIYRGKIGQAGLGWHGPYMALNRDCCEGFEPYSVWPGHENPSGANITTTYNCVKEKVMGQGSGGTPYTYECVAVTSPLFGTYTSLLGTPIATGGPQLPGTPTVYANDGCLANCGPQNNTGPKPFGGALYYEK